MRTHYLIVLIAIFLLATGCAEQKFDKVLKTNAINDPVFGENDGNGDWGTGEGDGNGDYGTGEGDGSGNPPWNTAETDFESYAGDYRIRLVCSNRATEEAGYNLATASALELRVIDQSGAVICKNANTATIKDTMVNSKKLAIPNCASMTANKYRIRLVDPSKADKGYDLFKDSKYTFISRKTKTSAWAIINQENATENQNDPSTLVDVVANEKYADDPLCEVRASPLIIKTDASDVGGIQLTSIADGILFDILGAASFPRAHAKKQISWITKSSYMFLAKPNAKGKVEGINELFGDNTMGPDGKFADDGYHALSKHDSNSDKVIDAKDAIFAELKLWSDKNFDGKSQKDELISLKDAGLEAIDLQYDASFSETDQYGNETKMKSVVKYSDGSYRLIFDLWFNYEGKRRKKEPRFSVDPIVGPRL